MTKAAERRAGQRHPGADLLALQERGGRLHLDAATLTVPAKVEATMRQWPSRGLPDLDADEGMKLAAMAMGMALELETFTPSHSGATAVDRLARQRRFDDEDLASGRAFASFDEALPPRALGLALAAPLCDLGGSRWGASGRFEIQSEIAGSPS